jgi:octaprenyl-diphosphate synthase
MSAACEAGALLGAVPPDKQKALADFGMDLGIAFQLMDDMLDYTATEEEFGKSIGHDLEEGKITLPLIHTLKNCTASERAVIGGVVDRDEMSLEEFRTVSGMVKKYGGIEITVEAARSCISRCRCHLDLFEVSPVRDALLSLSEYVVTRNK